MLKITSTLWQAAIMAYQYLRGRKLRTALTTLAIVFGVALIFAINISLPNLTAAFKGNLSASSGADLTIITTNGNSFAPEQALQTVASVKGVQAVSGLLRRQITLPTGGQGTIGKAPAIELVGLDPTTAETVRKYAMSAGRFFQPGDTGVAIFPAAIADLAPELKIGTTFPLITAGGLKFYTVIGFLAGQGNTATPQVIIPLSDAQAAFNQPGLINAIDISLQPGADRDAAGADIQKALGAGYQLDTSGSQSDIFASVQIGFGILDALGVLALFMGAFLIFNTFRAVILERRHDLGMLRAIGATRGQIVSMILIESLLQGIAGSVLGLILGYFLAKGLTLAFMGILKQYYPGLSFDVSITLPAVFGAVVIGLLTTLAAGYLPARSASRVSPLEALRPVGTSNVKRAARWGLIAGLVIVVLSALILVGSQKTASSGAILMLIGLILAAPGLIGPVAQLFSPMLSVWFAREGDLARGNLTRQPGRAAITASTLMIGLAVLILVAALVTSFNLFLTKLTNDSFAADVLVLPQALGVYSNVIGADESLSTRLQALPEVDTVVGLRYASTSSGNQALQVLGIDPQTYPKLSHLEFSAGSPDAAYAAMSSGRNALVNGLTASIFKVQPGDDLTIQTAAGPQTYHIVGVANDLGSFKLNTIFISQANMKTDFNKAEDVLLMLSFKPGADKTAALADIKNILKDYPQFSANLAGEYRDTLMNTISGAMIIFYALAILILLPSALGLLNTLTINILERTREIGVVRAVGGSKAQVRRIVTAEALLLGLFGSATGVLAGVAMSYGFIMAFSTVGWQMPYEFPVMGIIAAIVVGVLLALFSSILPANSAAKLDIIRALQFE